MNEISNSKLSIPPYTTYGGIKLQVARAVVVGLCRHTTDHFRENFPANHMTDVTRDSATADRVHDVDDAIQRVCRV